MWPDDSKSGSPVISTKCRPDQCAYDLAAGHAHPKKQVISSVVKTQPPQRSRVTILAQLSEKCRGESFLHPGRETPADAMEHRWLQATLELLVANGNKLLEIIRCRRRQQNIKAAFGDVIWWTHVL